jgi:hypothetical protein
MTIEAFAGDLGIAPRTVAYWRKQPTIIPQPAQQEALDAALDAAPDRAKAQFAMLVGSPMHKTVKQMSACNHLRDRST